MVPPMQVEDIDEVRLEFTERVAHAKRQAASVVSACIGHVALAEGVGAVIGGEFCGEDDLVAVFAGGHPFADPGFGLLVLVVVCCVYEVAAGSGEGVEEGEGLLFAYAAHSAAPGVADGHCAELEGGDADSGC